MQVAVVLFSQASICRWLRYNMKAYDATCFIVIIDDLSYSCELPFMCSSDFALKNISVHTYSTSVL